MISSRLLVRGLLAAGLVLALTLPSTAVAARLKVHFKATFDNPHGADISVVDPEVGSFQSSDPGSFPVESGQAGNGHVTISPTDGSDPVSLRAVLDPPFFGGGNVYASMAVTPHDSDGSINIRFLSEDDTPIIDVGFTPAGGFEVDGDSIGVSWDPGTTYWVLVEFTAADLGMSSSKVTIASEGTLLSNGAFAPSEPVVVENHLPIGGQPLDFYTIEFAVPAGIDGDLFELDNVRVVSPGTAMLHIK